MTSQLVRRPPRTHLWCLWYVAAIVAAATAAGTRAHPSPARADAPLQDFPPSMPARGRIVYTRQAVDAFDMFTADPDGSGETRLSEIDESAAGEDQPRWSPDGARVSFATFRDGAATFHIIAATGGVPRTVVLRDGASGDAAWSPDGRCLVYNGARPEDETAFDLKVWCDDGSPDGTKRTLTDTAGVDERDPDWSPDGSRIAFVALPHTPGANDRWTLHSIHPDGSDRRTILALPDEHVRFPRFDPDGERIGFIGNRQNLPFGTLSILDPVSGVRDRLCDLAADAWSWSPDGSELLFANISNGGVRVVEPMSGPVIAPVIDPVTDPLIGFLMAPSSRPWPVRIGVGAGADAGVHAELRGLATQYKGLYRIDIASRSVTRLAGAAGGAQAPNSATNFEFGFMPDWTAGTAAPTAGSATSTPTATAVEPTERPAATPSPSSTAAGSPSPSATPSPIASRTADGRAGKELYLPRLFRAPTPSRRR